MALLKVAGIFGFFVIGTLFSGWYITEQRSELMSGTLMSKLTSKKQLLIEEFNQLSAVMGVAVQFSETGNTGWRRQRRLVSTALDEFYRFAGTCSSAIAQDVSRFRAINDLQYPDVEDDVLGIMTIARLKPKPLLDWM